MTTEATEEHRGAVIYLTESSQFDRFHGHRICWPHSRRLTAAQGETMKSRRVSGFRNFFFLGWLILMAGTMFAASNIYGFTLPSIDGQPAPLADLKGKVVLVVNVASQCG